MPELTNKERFLRGDRFYIDGRFYTFIPDDYGGVLFERDGYFCVVEPIGPGASAFKAYKTFINKSVKTQVAFADIKFPKEEPHA